MQSRSWLTVLKVVFLTVSALVLADLVMLAVGVRNSPPPAISPIAVQAAAPEATPPPAEEVIKESIPMWGKHADITLEKPKSTPLAGASGQPDAQPSVAPVNVPDPSTQMVLVGTMGGGGTSIAIVMVGGKETLVKEHDQVGNPAFTVKEVRDNSVIMEMSGQQKTLWMPSFTPPVTAGGAGPNGAMLPPPPPATVNNAPQPPISAPPMAPGKSVIGKSERDKVMSDLPTTLQDLRILPNKKDNQDYGSKVVFLKPDSFLTKAGLTQGDILLAVNGKPVNNASQGLEVFQAFQYEDHIVMKIERGGKVIQQEVEFK